MGKPVSLSRVAANTIFPAHGVLGRRAEPIGLIRQTRLACHLRSELGDWVIRMSSGCSRTNLLSVMDDSFILGLVFSL